MNEFLNRFLDIGFESFTTYKGDYGYSKVYIYRSDTLERWYTLTHSIFNSGGESTYTLINLNISAYYNILDLSNKSVDTPTMDFLNQVFDETFRAEIREGILNNLLDNEL